jgi:hypothetical protein
MKRILLGLLLVLTAVIPSSTVKQVLSLIWSCVVHSSSKESNQMGIQFVSVLTI